MLNRTRRMRQAATYWPPAGVDQYGTVQLGPPEPVFVRWQEKAELFIDNESREAVSRAIVYPARPLLRQGYLFLGESTVEDPRGLPGAHEIRQVGASPNLRQTVQLNKVWL